MLLLIVDLSQFESERERERERERESIKICTLFQVKHHHTLYLCLQATYRSAQQTNITKIDTTTTYASTL